MSGGDLRIPHGAGGRRAAAGAAALVLLLVGLLYARRRADGATNVDDYLYAQQTSDFLTALAHGPSAVVDAWRGHAINSPLVPMLATPLAAIDASPSSLVLVQVPLLLGLFVACATLLRQLGVTGDRCWQVAALIVVLPPVLTYSVMLSFSIAAALCTVLCLSTYLASDRLRRTGPAAGFGAALGLLALTRVVAVVYLAAVLVPVVADLVLGRTELRRRGRGALLALAIALAIALPWWLTAGPAAWDYLLAAGYGDGNVFTSAGSLGQRLGTRLTRTADESGWLLSLLVAALFVTAVVGVIRAGAGGSSAGRHRRAVTLTAAVVVLGLLLLGTSTNAGTAFALPFVVLMACAGLAGAMRVADRLDPRLQRCLTVSTAGALACTVVAVFLTSAPPAIGGRQLWLSGTPAAEQVQAALGCSCPLPDAGRLNEDIYAVIGGQRTLVVRDDAIVNPESLRFLGRTRGTSVDLIAPPGGTTTLDPGLVASARYALAGTTVAPYHSVDLAAATQALRAAGFRPVLQRRLSAQNTVVLYAAPS